MTVSDAIGAICQDFDEQQWDARLFVHDSPLHMVAVAKHFKFAKGYSIVCSCLCWPHVSAKVPKMVFNSACLAG